MRDCFLVFTSDHSGLVLVLLQGCWLVPLPPQEQEIQKSLAVTSFVVVCIASVETQTLDVAETPRLAWMLAVAVNEIND